jgi:hypothetical protein
MLAAGVPVIVPAGCWLSEQLAGQINRHVESLASQSRWIVDQWTVQFRQFDGERSATCRLASDADDLAIQWEWPAELCVGAYLHLSVEFSGESNAERGVFDRSEQGRVGCVIPVPRGSRHLRFRLCSAYSDEPVGVPAVHITALRAPTRGGHHPRARVGLIAADDEQVPELIRELLSHYPHYRDSARVFSADWLQQHHADRTLELLESAMPTLATNAA